MPANTDIAALRPVIVVNPRSANGSTGRKWAALEAEARKILGPVDVRLTERPGHATELTREALRAGHKLVLAVGGDGTLNEVVNGFFDADGTPVAPDAQLTLLPRGTGGDFKRVVGLPPDWTKALVHVRDAKARPIDVGLLTFRNDDGSEGRRFFINEASIGIGAAVVDRVNRASKALGGLLSFYLASFRVIASWNDLSIKVSVDGGPAEAIKSTSYAIANGQFFGGGMWVAPDAKVDDGRFSVTHWRDYGLMDFIVRSKGIYSGSHVTWDRTRRTTATHVRIEAADEASAARPVVAETDGELVGRFPIEARILPGIVLFRA